jgi:hypothetical protein
MMGGPRSPRRSRELTRASLPRVLLATTVAANTRTPHLGRGGRIHTHLTLLTTATPIAIPDQASGATTAIRSARADRAIWDSVLGQLRTPAEAGG